MDTIRCFPLLLAQDSLQKGTVSWCLVNQAVHILLQIVYIYCHLSAVLSLHHFFHNVVQRVFESKFFTSPVAILPTGVLFEFAHDGAHGRVRDTQSHARKEIILVFRTFSLAGLGWRASHGFISSQQWFNRPWISGILSMHICVNSQYVYIYTFVPEESYCSI